MDSLFWPEIVILILHLPFSYPVYTPYHMHWVILLLLSLVKLADPVHLGNNTFGNLVSLGGPVNDASWR